MNCQQCREDLAAYLDGLADEPRRTRIDMHLAECPDCTAGLAAVRQVVAVLSREAAGHPAVSLTNAVMDRILQKQVTELRRLKMRRRIRLLGVGGVLAVAVAFFAVSSLWITPPASARTAAEVMAQGAEATPATATVHLTGRMRTLPHDNFALIGAEFDFVSIEVWREFGEKPKWRVEKPGRVAVMDGDSTTMLIKPEHVIQFPHASVGAFDTGWLLNLADVKDTITHELLTAQAKGWNLTLTHENTAAGGLSIVSVEAKSTLPADDYLHDKFFDLANTRRVYQFNTETRRLESFKAYLHRPKDDLLVVLIEHIDYGKPVGPTVFKLELPAKVNLYCEPEPVPNNEKYEKMTPEQAARGFFEACGRKDWNEVRVFMTSGITESFKESMGGIKLISLGKPFQSAISLLNGDWFVPYEIKFPKDTAELVVRNDNPSKRQVVVFPGFPFDQKKLAELKKTPGSEKSKKMTPKEAIEALFSAFTKKDAAEAEQLLGGAVSTEMLTLVMKVNSFEDAHIGDATLDKQSGFWHVPVTFSRVKKHTLALRPYKKAKRYIIDGGI